MEALPQPLRQTVRLWKFHEGFTVADAIIPSWLLCQLLLANGGSLLFFARARREAQLLSVPLLWIQAAGDIQGLGAQPKEEQAKVLTALLRHWNVHGTAHLHTLLPAYVGQCVCLTDNISADHRLVQEAEGTVVHVVLDPEECVDAVSGEVALTYCPLGIWVCFDDCKEAPYCNPALR